MNFIQLIRPVPDFPKPGILFRDITPVLENAKAFREVVRIFAERYARAGVQKVAGIESRGFIFGSAVAHELGVGLVLVRKRGKLPRPTLSERYALEYGEDEVHIHVDAVGRGERILILDDLIATGGTAAAAARLIGRAGGLVHEIAAVIELGALGGRRVLQPHPVHALVSY